MLVYHVDFHLFLIFRSTLDDSKSSTDSETTNSASKSVNSRLTDLYAKSPKPKAIDDSSDDVVMLVDAPNDENSTKTNEKNDKSMDIAETVEDEIDKVIEAGTVGICIKH